MTDIPFKKRKTTAAAAVAVFAPIFLFGALFDGKTELEKKHPVCVLGISDPTGVTSAGKAGIRNIYINWGSPFPVKAVAAIRASGAVPMITWEPYLYDVKHCAALKDIADGVYDGYISDFAGDAGGGALFLRFAHEPNSNWYAWSGVRYGPEIYVKSFRRVRTIFAHLAPANVKFVFSVNAEDVPATKWNKFENYYPGDEYADIIGIDAFNWGNSRRNLPEWKEPRQVLDAAYDRAVKAFPSKPLFLTEIASCSGGGDKESWIKQLFSSIGDDFPAVKAIIWFNMDKECDWSLSSAGQRGQFYGACGTGRIECSDKSLEWLFKNQIAEGNKNEKKN